MTAPRALRLLLAAVLALLGVVLVGGPARADTKVVTLGQQGPAPQIIDVKVGDAVRFTNSDSVEHTVASTGGGWSFSKTIAAGASATTAVFTKACGCTYSDTHTVVVVPQTDNGTVRVTATAPSPTPKPSATPTRSPAPRPSASAAPTTSPTPAPTQSGVALGPGLDPGVAPSAQPTATAGPRPSVAGPSPTVAPVGGVAYGDKGGVVQGSPHRYGLPAALGVVAIVGVVSLLVRLLLAQPEAREPLGPPPTVSEG